MLKAIVAGTIIYYFVNTTPALDHSKPSFTLYYASWCPHCKHMLDDWNALGSNVKGVAIRKLEEKQNTEIVVAGFPTIIYRDGNGGMEKYEGLRTTDAFLTFLQSKA